jgi:GxxExxY protein
MALKHQLVALAQRVFEALGPGYSETVYCRAIAVGLQNLQLPYESEKIVPVLFDNLQVGSCRLDLLVGDIVIEVKAVQNLTMTHRTQLRRYLGLLSLPVGLLLNFGSDKVDIEFLTI